MPTGIYPRKRTPEDTFWSNVDKGDPVGCWLWTGPKINTGYGLCSVGHSKKATAHRRAWEFVRGPIPEGLFVCHTCDVRACVNPAHLFLGTNSDNLQDSIRKGRFVRGMSKKTSCKHGHAFTPENTIVRPGIMGIRRECRQCRQDIQTRWKAKQAGADDGDDE